MGGASGGQSWCDAVDNHGLICHNDSLDMIFSPIINCLLEMDYHESIGNKIVELAIVAAYFPSGKISKDILSGYWCRRFGNHEFEEGMTQEFALQQLVDYNIITSFENNNSQMQIITGLVFRKYLLNNKDKINIIVKYMQEYMNDTRDTSTWQQKQIISDWMSNIIEDFPKFLNDREIIKDFQNVALDCLNTLIPQDLRGALKISQLMNNYQQINNYPQKSKMSKIFDGFINLLRVK